MKNIKYAFLILLFFVSINVKAIDPCTTDELVRLKELSNNVTFNYDYEIEEQKDDDGNYLYSEVYYHLNLLNDNENLRIYYNLDEEYDDILLDKNTFNDNLFSGGQYFKYKIYAYTPNMCINKLLKSSSIKFPFYNEFYHSNKDKCEEYKDFEYCKELIDKNLSKEEIENLFNKYINKDNANKKENKSNDNGINIINIIYIIVPIVIIVFIIIFILIKKRKKQIKF